MMHPKLLFVEFGSVDVNHFRQGVLALPVGVVEAWKQVGSEVGKYAPVEGGLDEAINVLLREESVCVDIRPKDSDIKWILLIAPNALESHVSMWHGVLELRSVSHERVFQILKGASLQYVAVAKDDPFDLTDMELRPESFPWNSPLFVAAALGEEGGYLERAPR